MMKSYYKACLYLLFCLIGAVLGAAKAENAKDQSTILVVGDSLSAAYNIPNSEGWVQLLEKQVQKDFPNYTVLNSAISGDTTENALTQLPSKLNQYKPKITVICIGGNDGLRAFPLKKIQTNLDKIISLSKNHGEVLLLGIQIPPNYGKRYTEAFKQIYYDLAEKHQVPFMPFLLKGVALKEGFMQADGIHPTVKAQPVILANVFDYLRPLLKKG